MIISLMGMLFSAFVVLIVGTIAFYLLYGAVCLVAKHKAKKKDEDEDRKEP